MKINKRKPWHWLYLLAFGLHVACAMVLRPILHRGTSGRVLLYGHKLAGNLLELYCHARRNPAAGLQFVFMTMDPVYHRQLRKKGIDAVLAISPAAISWLATADAVISDHGLHAMQPMLARTDLKFFDAWHGIPFKGFDADDFRIQRRYHQTWVASDLCRKLYVDRFGFDGAKVIATGYARTDRLVRGMGEESAFRASFGVPVGRKTILFAPTWAQDDHGRSIFPFGCDEGKFVGALSDVAEAHDAVILLRTHLNTDSRRMARAPNVIVLGAADFPDTEAVLMASDVLICDWSSIAFDFMLLDRPTIFLDVPPPFSKGFSLGPEYRFGEVVENLEQLTHALRICVSDVDAYWKSHAVKHRVLKHEIYGDKADGNSAARCLSMLQDCLAGTIA